MGLKIYNPIARRETYREGREKYREGKKERRDRKSGIERGGRGVIIL